ncbi:hypothetical protein Tco_0155882 [Tanacetum coccineum]
MTQCFIERLLYDNSFPRPPEAFRANFEEIDLFTGPDDSIPLGIESDDFDSEDDDNSTSRPEFESFHVDYPDSGDSTIDVVEDIPIDVPNILPTHLALQLDFNFIPSLNDLGSDLDVSSPSGDSNKIYDPGICIEVESTRFLSTLSPVIDTLLSFSSENKDKVFNHGVLASKEKSSSSLSLRGFKASKLFHQKSPMLIHGDNTPNLEKEAVSELKFFLGLQVHQSPRGIFISQSQYAIELLKKHGLDECVSMSTPMATERLDADLQGTPTDQMTYRRMIGGLMYLTASRPDIAFATFVCAHYQARPTVKHLKEVKWIFRYLRQSYNMGLWYPTDSGFELIAFLDADHACCKDDCKSTSGGLQFLGGKLVSRSLKKQDYTAMFTAEAEYVSLSACYAQVIWMRTQLLDYGFKYNQIPMYCDSKSAIAISCNPVQYSKTKHIDIRYHFIKEHVKRGTVEIYFVGTEYQLADLFTKALPKERFEYLVHRIVIIMAQRQQAADVHQDDLCPPNKRYDLMDANKKVDLENVQCPSESKILMNIITNHPLRFSIAASASVPWIYMAQFWHTLKEDGSKNRLKFLLDRKELTLTLDDFRTIFHLPQANDNNHASFVPPPSFSDMVPFYKQVLGFTMELKSVSNFKIPGLLQPWQTLCKIFSKCLTTRVTGWDQPPLQIMQMLYCFVNNIHVDYAELMWEGIYYSLHHPATSIPYPRFTKIIISHYMTIFPEISRRARDAYHNLQDDDIMKNIFNSGRNKNKVGMRIPAWMITEEMKLTEHYKMYAEVFGLDVPLSHRLMSTKERIGET